MVMDDQRRSPREAHSGSNTAVRLFCFPAGLSA